MGGCSRNEGAHVPPERGTEAKPRGGYPLRNKTLPRHTIRSAKRDRRQGRRPCATSKRSKDGASLSPRRGGPRQSLEGVSRSEAKPFHFTPSGAQSATADSVGVLARHQSEAPVRARAAGAQPASACIPPYQSIHKSPLKPVFLAQIFCETGKLMVSVLLKHRQVGLVSANSKDQLHSIGSEWGWWRLGRAFVHQG